MDNKKKFFASNRIKFREKNFLYTPYFCEENIWHLCQHSQISSQEIRIIFISNDKKICPFFYQRACSSPQYPVWWDYHVILICKERYWVVWDLDTVLTCPIQVEDYLRFTFGDPDSIPQPYSPRFKVIVRHQFIQKFSSDRSHMRTPSGQWVASPPPWPQIFHSGKNTLNNFIKMTPDTPLEPVFTQQEFGLLFNSKNHSPFSNKQNKS